MSHGFSVAPLHCPHCIRLVACEQSEAATAYCCPAPLHHMPHSEWHLFIEFDESEALFALVMPLTTVIVFIFSIGQFRGLFMPRPEPFVAWRADRWRSALHWRTFNKATVAFAVDHVTYEHAECIGRFGMRRLFRDNHTNAKTASNCRTLVSEQNWSAKSALYWHWKLLKAMNIYQVNYLLRIQLWNFFRLRVLITTIKTCFIFFIGVFPIIS